MVASGCDWSLQECGGLGVPGARGHEVGAQQPSPCPGQGAVGAPAFPHQDWEPPLLPKLGRLGAGCSTEWWFHLQFGLNRTRLFGCWRWPLPRAQGRPRSSSESSCRVQPSAFSLLGLAPAPVHSHKEVLCPGCQSWAPALFFLVFLLYEMQRTWGNEDGK